MSIRRSVFVVVVLLSLGATGCGDGITHTPAPSTPTAATERYCGADYLDVEARIDALLPRLSLEQEVALMHGTSLFPVDGSSPVPGIPGLGIPGLHMIDGPRGISTNSGAQATAFPVGMARAAAWDPELERRVGQAMGVEARAVGADVLLAPTMNILRHPRWGRAQETYGEDPYLMAEIAVPFVQGVQENVLASAKHFTANSIEDTRFQVNVTMDERTLREIYLPHFRRVVQEGPVASVMSAYNSVNGAFCSENTHLLHDILKGEWEFQGFVESDWVYGTHDTVRAADAGLDIEMPTANIYGQPLIDAVQSGAVSWDTVDEAVRRILRAQLCYGLDTDPPVSDPSRIATAAHTALAREVAQRSIVLLQNQGAVLPLDAASPIDIVLVGRLVDVENIGDTGSSSVTPPYVVTALEGIRAAAAAGSATVTHIPSEPLSAAELATVAAADVVVVVTGLTSADEGEGLIGAGDRASLELPASEQDLINQVGGLGPSGPPVVVVLEGGAAITMSGWLGAVDALLMAWYPGMEGGNAIADVLFGDVAPSGRLPISFPVAESDLPPFDNVSLEVTYGYFHGYRYLQNEGTAPLFPFGHGLSYTTFDYSNLSLSATSLSAGDTLTVTADVTNTGSVAGVETVQLYVGAVGSSVVRAPRDLRAFTQLSLAPGETQTATLEVPVADLAYFDVASASWVVEPLSYLVEVGSSSEDQPLSATVTVL